MTNCEHSSEILIARINKGEKVVGSILDFCQKNNIAGAWITGIGAISKAKLALYNLDKKTYIKKELNGPFEIASMSGNIGLLNKKHIAHIHVVISDKLMNAFGGHLEEAIVSATCEIKIELFDQPISRKYDRDIGLNLIQIS